MKYGLIFSLCALCPAIAFADSLDNKIATLTKQKMDLINSLEKCQKATGNLKVAGIATLGVSAIGVGANVTQAKKIKTQNAKISNLQDTQTSLETQIEQKKAEEARLATEIAARQAITQQQEQQEQQGEDATEKRVEEEIVEGENENKDDIVVPEDKVKENPTERTDGGECTAAELASESAATGKWSVKSDKCIPTSCVGGAWLVLKNGISQGWCVKKCSEFKDYDSNEGPWPDGGKYCELTPKLPTAEIKTEHEQAPAGDFTTKCESIDLGEVYNEGECQDKCREHENTQRCVLEEPYFHLRKTDYHCVCNPTNEDFNYQQLKPQLTMMEDNLSNVNTFKPNTNTEKTVVYYKRINKYVVEAEHNGVHYRGESTPGSWRKISEEKSSLENLKKEIEKAGYQNVVLVEGD